MSIRCLPFVLFAAAPFLMKAPAAMRHAPSCPAVAGLDSLVRPNVALLFGELHGTQQSPAFLGDVLCHVVTKRIPVTLGLEWPAEMTPTLQQFLNSDGGVAAKAKLFADPYWRDPTEDGRRSEAMVSLLERARMLRAGGGDIRIVAFSAAQTNSVARDSAMAETLAQHLQESRGRVVIVLTGNIHSRLTIGTPFNPAYRPMGFMLRRLVRVWTVHGLNASYDAGTAWICMNNGCGPTMLKGKADVPDHEIRLRAEPDPDGYDGRYGIGSITVSKPAPRPADSNKR